MARGLAGNKVRTIICEGCGGTVTRRMRPGAKFCSLPCYRAAPKPARRTGTEKACEQCGATFYAQAHRAADARFCGNGCQSSWQGRNKTEHTCKICGVAFRWSPSRTSSGAYSVTYCSIPCRDADPDVRAALLARNADLQRGRTTSAERTGYALLDGLGVDYLRQETFAGKFTPDALVPAVRLAIQFDGDYWHDRAGNSTEPRIVRRRELDRSQDAYLAACGWRVLRLWESDLKRDPAACAELIRRHLRPAS